MAKYRGVFKQLAFPASIQSRASDTQSVARFNVLTGQGLFFPRIVMGKNLPTLDIRNAWVIPTCVAYLNQGLVEPQISHFANFTREKLVPVPYVAHMRILHIDKIPPKSASFCIRFQFFTYNWRDSTR